MCPPERLLRAAVMPSGVGLIDLGHVCRGLCCPVVVALPVARLDHSIDVKILTHPDLGPVVYSWLQKFWPEHKAGV